MAIRHKIRADGNGTTKVINLIARRAIIEFCKECMGFNSYEVRGCPARLCPLFPFRTPPTPKKYRMIALCSNMRP